MAQAAPASEHSGRRAEAGVRVKKKRGRTPQMLSSASRSMMQIVTAAAVAAAGTVALLQCFQPELRNGRRGDAATQHSLGC